MATEPYRMTMSDLLMSMRRRALVLGISFGLILLLALAVAIALPPVFKSTGIILVESQQIPQELLPNIVTASADERIQGIRQRVMTRENQLQIIEKHDLFAEEGISMSTSDMLAVMQRSTEISPIKTGSGRRSETVAFELSFEHRSPKLAQAVANELVTLFLNENARTRTQRASETTDFLTREARKLETELAELESRLAAHKQRYSNALPEHLEMRMGMLQRAEAGLGNNEREIKSTLEEIRFLELELAAAKSGVRTEDNRQDSGAVSNTLAGLTQEYERLKQIYTEHHPDVIAVSRRLAASERAGDIQVDNYGREGLTEADLRVAQVQARIDAAGTRLTSLRDQEAELETKIEDLEGQILETPQVQRTLSNLMRDYNNAQLKFQEIRAKQIDAQIMESLERDEKAERFSLLEPPLFPSEPAKPNRSKIMLFGFFFAIGSSGGLALMLEAMNRRVRGRGALTQLFGRSPLVVIPYITTVEEVRKRRMRRLTGILVLLALVVVAAALTHVLYIPLDHMIVKIVARLG